MIKLGFASDGWVYDRSGITSTLAFYQSYAINKIQIKLFISPTGSEFHDETLTRMRFLIAVQKVQYCWMPQTSTQ